MSADQELPGARLADYVLIRPPGEASLMLWHRACQHTLGVIEHSDTLSSLVEAAALHKCPPRNPPGGKP